MISSRPTVTSFVDKLQLQFLDKSGAFLDRRHRGRHAASPNNVLSRLRPSLVRQGTQRSDALTEPSALSEVAKNLDPHTEELPAAPRRTRDEVDPRLVLELDRWLVLPR